MPNFRPAQAALQEQIAALLAGFAERKAGEVATAVAAVRQQIGTGQHACTADLQSLTASIQGTSTGLQVRTLPVSTLGVRIVY